MKFGLVLAGKVVIADEDLKFIIKAPDAASGSTSGPTASDMAVGHYLCTVCGLRYECRQIKHGPSGKFSPRLLWDK